MAIATGAALLGAAALGAGTSLIGGKRAADASKKAAQTQRASGDQALALQRDIWQNQQQLMSPFVQGGNQAFANMQRMAGGQGPGPAPAPPPGAPNGFPSGMVPGAISLGQAMGGGGMKPPQPGIPLGQAMGAPMSAPPQEMGGGMVTLQMPDGSTQQMPRAAAQPMLMRGAQIVA